MQYMQLSQSTLIRLAMGQRTHEAPASQPLLHEAGTGHRAFSKQHSKHSKQQACISYEHSVSITSAYSAISILSPAIYASII